MKFLRNSNTKTLSCTNCKVSKQREFKTKANEEHGMNDNKCHRRQRNVAVKADVEDPRPSVWWWKYQTLGEGNVLMHLTRGRTRGQGTGNTVSESKT